MSRRRSHFRLLSLLILISLLAVVLLYRLYELQVVHGETYRDRADDQYVRPVRTFFERGSIRLESRSGEDVYVATMKDEYVVYMVPDEVVDAAGELAQLKEVIEIDSDLYYEALAKAGDPYEVLAKRQSEEVKIKLDELDLAGIRTHSEPVRYYPLGDSASQEIGFVGYKGDERTGLTGVEAYYDDVLRRAEDDLYVNFFAETLGSLGDERAGKNAWGDVVLTLEPTVQKFVEDELKQINARYRSQMSGVIVIEPKTGKVRAMASNPTFDLNDFRDADPDLYHNPNVSDVYEMGSIIKALTMAAGIDSGAVAPSTTYNDLGQIKVDGRTISNYDGRGRGVIDMQGVLNNSLNTGVSFVVGQMGKQKFADYFKKFGLRETTNIDLPAEATNLTDNLNSPRTVEYYTASFGQGIALTPISTARALSALGNGGILMQPQITERLEYRDGSEKQIEPVEQGRVISEQSSETISRMLVKVVDQALKGGKVALPEYSIAAKTGTAQMARPEGGYYPDRYFHSFFGYFPAFDPQFLVLYYTMDPRGVNYASETLTDPFIETAKFLIHYYEIPPDRAE